MLRLECDYLEGADKRVLEALTKTNAAQTPGYGEDEYCESARALIRELCQAPQAGVHFFVGGTQANLTVIAAALRPYEGVLAAPSAHINTHETGAVEATGHKVLVLPGDMGKLSASEIESAVLAHKTDATHEHIVKPGMVYLSHPTELGTLYTRREIEDIRAVCLKHGLTLYIDGARLGYALAAEPEVSLPFLAASCDAFTIGGTKVGALFGEAMVLTKDSLKCGFRSIIKQRGGLLAKGRLLGVQFLALLEDGYYARIAGDANALAQRLKDAFVQKGYALSPDTRANQIFPVLPDAAQSKLSRSYSFSRWESAGEGLTVVRFCVGVTTPPHIVESLIKDIPDIG